MSTEESGFECEFTPVVEAEFQPEADVKPSEAVITALAEAKDVEPTELDPLYETIDGEALDQLFTSRDGEEATPSRTFRFSVESWNIFIDANGSVVVCDSDQQTEAAPVFSEISAD